MAITATKPKKQVSQQAPAPLFQGAPPAEEHATNPEKFAALFADDSKWQHVRGVPIFDAHSEQYSMPGPDGQPQPMTEDFDQARLQRIADNCNALVQGGNPIGLTLGHTQDKGAETAQPETLGYGSNYRVQMHPQLNKPCVFHDERFYPDKFETAKSLPFRSVERWRPSAENQGDYFKPVALLRREPRRQLGPVAYQVGSQTIIRYSMEYAMPTDPAAAPPEPPQGAAPPAPPQAAPPAAPAEPPMEEQEPSPKDHALYAKLYAAHPHYAMHCASAKKYEAEMGGMPGQQPGMPPGQQPQQNAQAAGQKAMWSQVDAGAGKGENDDGYNRGEMKGQWHLPASKNAMGMPGGSNTAPPAMLPKGPQQMSADTQLVERYQALESEVADLRRSERVARYHAGFAHLERDGYQIDAIDEVTRCQDYTQPQFEQHVNDIKKYGEKTRRAVGPAVDTRGPSMNGSGRALTEEEFRVAQKWMEENPGKTTQDAIKYAQNAQPVRG